MHVERDSLLGNMQAKREDLNERAHRQREVRDRLNDQTRAFAHRRDELNAQVRAIVDEANKHRALRDERNRLVREAKLKRDELNREAHARAEALQALRQQRGQAADGQSLHKLRAEIRHLEFQQQTQALSPKKEKELIEVIAAKMKELKAREGSLHEDAELQQAFEATKAAKAAAEAQHQHVTQLALQAQAEHDAMAKLFAQADTLRQQADAAQADFVKNKVEADKVHQEYVRMVSDIRDLTRVHAALGGHGGPAAPATPQDIRAEADEIFEKFRKGGKLSTEDFMALQKGDRR